MSRNHKDTQRLATLQRQWSVKCSDLIELYKLYLQAEFHYYKHLRKNLLLKLRALGLPYQICKNKALELREYYQQRVALLEEQLAWLKQQQLHFPGVGVAHDNFLQQNLDARIFNYYQLKQRELPSQTRSRLLSSQYYLLGELQRFYADVWLQGYVPSWSSLLNMMHELWLPHLSDHEIAAWGMGMQQLASQAQELRNQALQAKLEMEQELLNLASPQVTRELERDDNTQLESEPTDTPALIVALAASHSSLEQELASNSSKALVGEDGSTSQALDPNEPQLASILAQDLWSLFADFESEATVTSPANSSSEASNLSATSQKTPQVKSQRSGAKFLQQSTTCADSGHPRLGLTGFARERELWHKVYVLGQQYSRAQLVQMWGLPYHAHSQQLLTQASEITNASLLGEQFWLSCKPQLYTQAQADKASLGVERFYLRLLWNSWGIPQHFQASTAVQQLNQQYFKLEQLRGKLETYITRVQLFLAQTELNFNRRVSEQKTQHLLREDQQLAQQLTSKPYLQVNRLQSPWALATDPYATTSSLEDLERASQDQVTLEAIATYGIKDSLESQREVADQEDEPRNCNPSSQPQVLKLTTILKIGNFLTPHVNLSELELLGNRNIYHQLEDLLQEQWESFLLELEALVLRLTPIQWDNCRTVSHARWQRLQQALEQLLAPLPTKLAQEIYQQTAVASSSAAHVIYDQARSCAVRGHEQVELPWSLERTLGMLSWVLRTLAQLYPELSTAPNPTPAARGKSRAKQHQSNSHLEASRITASKSSQDNSTQQATTGQAPLNSGLELPVPLTWLGDVAQGWLLQVWACALQQILSHLAHYKWLAPELVQEWHKVLQDLQTSEGAQGSLSPQLTLLQSLYFNLELLQIHLGALVATCQLTSSIQAQAQNLLATSGNNVSLELKDYSLKDSARNQRSGRYAQEQLPWGKNLTELFEEDVTSQGIHSQGVALGAQTQIPSSEFLQATRAQVNIPTITPPQTPTGLQAKASGAERDAALGDEWHHVDARREQVDYALARYLTMHKMQATGQCARVPYVSEALEKTFARYGAVRNLNNLVGINLGADLVPIPELREERSKRNQYEARIAQGVATGHVTYLEEAQDTIAYLVDVTVTIPPHVIQAKRNQTVKLHLQRKGMAAAQITPTQLNQVLATLKSQDGTRSELDLVPQHPHIFKFRVRVSREVLLPDHTSFNLNTRLFAARLWQSVGLDLYFIERNTRMRGMLPGLRTYGSQRQPLTRKQLEQMLIEIAYAQAQRQLAHASVQNGNPRQLRVDGETGEALPYLDLTELRQPQILLEQLQTWDEKGQAIVPASLPPTLKALWLQAGELARNYALGVTGYEPETPQAQDVACVDFTKVEYQPNSYYLNSRQGQQELYLALALAERVTELFAQQEQILQTSAVQSDSEPETDLSLTPTQALEQLRRFVMLHQDILEHQLGQTPSRANNYSYLGYYDRQGHWQHIITPQFLLELVHHPASYALLVELRAQQQLQREQMQREQLRAEQEQAQLYRAKWLPPVLREQQEPVSPSADPLFRLANSQIYTRVGTSSTEVLSASEAQGLLAQMTRVAHKASPKPRTARGSASATWQPRAEQEQGAQERSTTQPPVVRGNSSAESCANSATRQVESEPPAEQEYEPLRKRFKGRLYSERLRNLLRHSEEQEQLLTQAQKYGGVRAHPSQRPQLAQRLAQQQQAREQRNAYPGKFLQPRKVEIPKLEDLWQERVFKDWGQGITRPPSFKLILEIEASRRAQLEHLRLGWKMQTELGPEELEPGLYLDPQQMYPSYEEIPREYRRPPEKIRSYAQQVRSWYADGVSEEAPCKDQDAKNQVLSLQSMPEQRNERSQLPVPMERATIDLEQAQVWGDMVALPLEAMFLSPEQQQALASQKLQALDAPAHWSRSQGESRESRASSREGLFHSEQVIGVGSVREATPSAQPQVQAEFGSAWQQEFGKARQVVPAQGALEYLRAISSEIATARAKTEREICQHELPPVEGFSVSGGQVRLVNGQVREVIPGTVLTPQMEQLEQQAQLDSYVASLPPDAQAEFAQETLTPEQAEQRVYATPENGFEQLEAFERQALLDFVGRELPELVTDLDLDEGTSLEALVASLEMQDGQLYQREITAHLLEGYDIRKLRPTTERVIFHCDINNCYASIEQQLNPELKGKPIAVTGNVENRHGIVLAKSNQAKKYGIKTGDTVHQAKQKCRHLICVPPHSHIYKQFSHRAHQIYACYTDMIESFGIDEVWLDVTDVVHHYESPVHLAHLIRKRIYKELGVTISVGVSFNKVFAKLGSDLKKPNAVTEINYYNYEKLLYPLAIEEMVGIGRSTCKALQQAGIFTIGDLAQADYNQIARRFGYGGKVAWINANGLNFSAVAHMHDRPKEKTIGHGLTFKEDLTTYAEVYAAFQELALDVAQRLIRAGKYARAIQISVRDKDFATRQFQAQLQRPSYSSLEFARLASSLFQANLNEPFAIRQLTIRAINLIYQAQIDEFPDFESLFNADPEHERNLRMQQTLTMVREKFGKHTLNFASSLLNTKVGDRNTIPFADKIVHAESQSPGDEGFVESYNWESYNQAILEDFCLVEPSES